jgi:hypothetical protein
LQQHSSDDSVVDELQLEPNNSTTIARVWLSKEEDLKLIISTSSCNCSSILAAKTLNKDLVPTSAIIYPNASCEPLYFTASPEVVIILRRTVSIG